MRTNLILLLAIACTVISKTSIARKDSSKLLYIRNIQFKGNKITKEFVIRREMKITEGDSIPRNKLDEVVEFNRLRIMNCQLFIKAMANVKNWIGDSIDIEYTVKELFYWNVHPYVSLADRNFNVWWDDYNHKFNRLNIGADINRKNFRGRGEEIGIEAQAGFNKHLYLYYSNPFIDKSLKHGIKASLAYNTGKEIQARTDSNKQVFFRDENRNPYRWLRAEFSVLYRPKYAAVHELRFSFHHYALMDNMYGAEPDYLGGRQIMNIPEIMYRYRYNNTDDRNYPIDGWEVDTYFDQKGWGLVKDFNQMQFYTHIARYIRLNDNLSSSFHFRGRLFGPDKQPYFNYRAMGYKNDYVRGFEYYIIDGSHYALMRSDLRYRLFSYNLKQNILPILRDLPIVVYPKIYGDAGYVHSNNFGNSYLNNQWLYGYGVGVDIVLSYYLKVRLEYSFNSLREKGLFLHLRNE